MNSIASHRRLSFVAWVAAVFTVSLCLASYSDLEVSVSGISGNAVTVSAHNPTADPQSARVVVTVLLDNGLLEPLVSESFTVGPGATTPVVLSASGIVSSVIDGPDPFPPF